MDTIFALFLTTSINTGTVASPPVKERSFELLTRTERPTLPTEPFAPVMPLFLAPVDSDLLAFLVESHALLESCPRLVAAVESDLDRHGLRKKELRVADARWVAEHSLPLPGSGRDQAQDQHKPLELEQGRTRTPGYVVLIALLLRGFFGAGFKAQDVTSMMLESITLRVFFQNLGLKMPGRSTLTELINAVTNETRLLVLDAQVARALKLKLDDFTTMIQDSTHVGGNTKWPTDSRLMVALVERLLRVGSAMGRVPLPVVGSEEARKAFRVIVQLDREIDMSRGKKTGGRDRRRRYEKLLKKAKRVHKLLAAQAAPLCDALAALNMRPSQKALAARAVERLHKDLDALGQVIPACEARVLRDEKVLMSEKVLSVSDPDAGYISKGQRESVIGYKPQIARSGAGFITGLLLPQGNAADSGQLVPMVNQVVARTGVVPTVVSVDDGYASAENVRTLKMPGLQIPIISINGAKGRALTTEADWESDEYADARNLRSAVESLMFTLKQGYHFGEVARRGLWAAYAELLEKALAYNVCQTVRRREAAAAKSKHAPTLAAA